MANRYRGEIEIQLCGASRTIGFSFEDICELEIANGGRALEVVIADIGFSLSKTFLCNAMFYGLRTSKRSKMTLDAVRKIIAKEIHENEGAHMRLLKAVFEAAMVGDGKREDEIANVLSAFDKLESDDDGSGAVNELSDLELQPTGPEVRPLEIAPAGTGTD